MNKNQYDIIIVGAGPAGSTCALTLKDSGLNVALFDKSEFPRLKPCGDAIPGEAFEIMTGIDPLLGDELWNNPKREIITASRIIGEKQRDITIQWVNKAYNCPRYDFDNYLLNMVKKHCAFAIHTGAGFKDAIQGENEIILKSIKERKEFRAKLVIGADGANSLISRKLAAYRVDRNHNSAAVRAYYSGVSEIKDGVTELFFLKKYLPGYFWIFPLGNEIVNAGFGMLSSSIVKHKININKAFHDFIENHPEVSRRFKKAVIEGELQGHNLPHGSRKIKISGPNFMLIGDAASLVDPLDGHGIDKAMLSGKLAAEQAINCFKNEDFSALFTARYETKLQYMISSDMEKNYRLMTLLSSSPWLLDAGLRLARIPFIKRRMLKAIFS